MPSKHSETVADRRNEIVNACEKIYRQMSFKEITIKEIGKITPFKRTSIYNYFHTKEEIFLALLQREYGLWADELQKIIDGNDNLSKEELADKLAKSLENRKQLLKLMSMNHFEMEMNSRLENLTEFKKAYGKSLHLVKNCLDKFCPELNDAEKENFIYIFFPFVYGIYPYAEVTEKQKVAMETAQVNYKFHSIYELAYNCAMKLLS